MQRGIVEGSAELGSLVALRKNAQLFFGAIVLAGEAQQFKKESSLGDIAGVVAQPRAEGGDGIGNPAGSK